MVRRTTEPSAEPGRAPGRPRRPELDRAILEATLRQMAELGYDGMTIEGVAACAGTTKPTIYRRWKSKADLATSALALLQAEEPPAATGSARADAIALLRNFRTSLLRPHGMAMLGTLLAEEERTPELMALMRERIVATRRRMLSEVLSRGQGRGELQADADIDAAVNLLIGSFYARYLTGEGIPETWPARVVDVVWRGLATPDSDHG